MKLNGWQKEAWVSPKPAATQPKAPKGMYYRFEPKLGDWEFTSDKEALEYAAFVKAKSVWEVTSGPNLFCLRETARQHVFKVLKLRQVGG